MSGTVDLTIDLYLAGSANRTNSVMKNLTVISTCMMSMTLISSIYGMNFRHMPELEWQYGYPLALLAMVASVGIALGIFKWRKYI
jgi:magnesium transporter